MSLAIQETDQQQDQKQEVNSEDQTIKNAENSPATAITDQTGCSSVPDWDNCPLPDDEIVAEPMPEMSGAEFSETSNGNHVVNHEVFHHGFCTALTLAGHATQLETLKNAASQETANEATQAMYDIIVDTPALHFLIEPSSIWVQRAFAIGAFVVPVGAGCMGELKNKKLGVKNEEE